MAQKPQAADLRSDISLSANILFLLFIFIFSLCMMPPSLLHAAEVSEKSPAATAPGENKTVLLTDAAAAGALTVASEPSPAFVYLDGKETGSTPIAIKNITAGEHIITVTKEGYADSSQSIIIKPGGITEAYARLDHESLIVRITTAPEGADIFWDEMNKGTSPVTIENVSKGRHKIRLSKEDHDEQVDIIEVTAPVTEKSYQLRPHTGGITVKTEPAGAEVRIDGKAVGKTPLSIGSLPVKNYSVKLGKKGYVEKEITVIVPRDKTVKLEETLLLADTQRPEIIFEPVSKLIRENKNLISAKVIDNQAMGEVSLLLKMANEVNFQTIKMTDRLNGFYETQVPDAYLPAGAMLDYYISACDAQNNCETSGSPEAPHHISVISLAPRTEGYVLEVDKKRAMISIGSMDNVHKGDHYIVFRTGKEYRNPVTNELLYVEEILVGTLKIKDLMPKTAYADIDDSFFPFETNDRIRKQPSPPREAVTENIHSSKIVLRWAPNPEPEVKGYYIYRADKLDGDYRRIAKTDNRENTYYEDKDHMKEGLTFYYRVAAVNMLKTEGIMSEPIVGRTKGTIQPPADFRTDGTRVREVSLRWKAHQNDPDMDKYVIFRSESESGNFSEAARVGKNTDNYSDRDRLQDGKTYYYRIASYSKNGSVGAHSPVVTAKTKELPAPPENIRAESGAARKIKLQWNRHEDKDVAGYIIYRSGQEKGNYTETGKTAEPEYIDNDLPDGKTYYYTVASYFSARADEVKGQPSGPVSAITKQRPKAPQNAAAQSGLPKKTVIKWDRNGEKDISEYLIYRGNNSKPDTSPYARVEPDVSAFTDNDLKNNATYLYAVRAVDADGLESDLSETVIAVTKPLPSNPAGLSGQVKGEKVLLSWKPNPEQDIKGYNVYKKKWFGSSLLVSAENNSCEISPDDDGKSIKLYVTAIDRDALESEPSEIIEVMLKQ